MPLTFNSEPDSLPGPGGVKEEDVSPGTKEAPKRRGRPPGSTNRAKLTHLEEKLKEKLLEDLVVPVAFASPLAAKNTELRAERTGKAATGMAAKNPAVRKGIERILDGSDAFTLV